MPKKGKAQAAGSSHKETLWYQHKIDDVHKKLNSSPEGLTGSVAKTRKEKYGPNKLPEKKSLGAFAIFVNQFKSAFIYILLIAAGISYFLHESIDASVILAAVLINVIVGFFQEKKAMRALEALQKVVTSEARVMRDGNVKIIPASELVPGDVVLLQAGDKVPADMRLLSEKELKIAEASLSGESEPVSKSSAALTGDLVLGDQINMAFMSTVVVQGSGRGLVVATGLETSIGQIASLVRETEEEPTPLQIKLDKFSKKLALLVLAISTIILVVGLLSQHSLGEMFTTAVAVAVAAIPEGLVVAVTVILAVGMRRILKEQGLVKKLLAAETLGSTSVICTDKTGTLTQGEMRVAQIVGESAVRHIDDIETAETEAEHSLSLRIGVLCNNALFTVKSRKKGEINVIGSPTEKALLLAGWQSGLDKENLDKKHPRLDEIPFDSKRKYMMTLHKISKKENIVYFKGASEKVLEMCTQVYQSKDGRGHQHLPLTSEAKKKEKKQYEKMSQEGLRVLAVAYKMVPAKVKSFQDIEQSDFIFVGFMGLHDPLRPDTRETIEISEGAGVRTIMITGDHKLTAQAIAKELGLPHEDSNVLTGPELAKLSASELKMRAPKISIYARVTPEDKLKIVRAWQERGAVVAMTGDGVNDAPALKKADIGVAVGSGTDVSKETADLILLDDDFKTIVSAIRQGRVIYDNVKKVILYFLSDSFTEMIIIVFGLLMGWPLPVLAGQILWVNIVDDTFPALALTKDPEEPENMSEPPEPREKPILDKERRWLIVIISLVTALDTLVLFWLYWQGDPANLAHARSVAFVTMGMDSLLYIFSVRTLRKPVWRTNIFKNKLLVAAVLISMALQAIAVYVPIFEKFLRTVPLSLFDWIVIISVSLLVIIVIESVKGIFFRIQSKKSVV